MFQKYKLLIPTIILFVLSTWTFINSGEDYSLTIKHYFGLTTVLLCLISFFVLKKFYKYVLGTTLLLGLINLCNFTPALTSTMLGFNSLSISFQPYSLLLIILTVILVMPKSSEFTVVNSDTLSGLTEKQFNEDFEKFKKLFDSKSIEELTEIITDKKFIIAAKKAAQQILDERLTEKGSA